MYARRVAIFTSMDKNGKILLQHRGEDTPTKKNMWAFFGGEIEDRETPEEAVRREAEEEICIKLKNLKLFKRYEFQEPYGSAEKFMFIAETNASLEELKEQQTEGQDLGFFSFKELEKLEISDNDMKIIKDVLNIN